MESKILSEQSESAFLGEYVVKQISSQFPDGFNVNENVMKNVPYALDRVKKCISSIKPWNKQGFDYLVSWQYATFLYFLANRIWIETGSTEESIRLFLLNKSLNGMELFYEVKMPQCFFLSHTPGLVFSKATYGDYCVFHQGCTIGRSSKGRPLLENGVVLLPNSMIIGDCVVRENTVIGPGVSLINMSTPGNCYVFQGKAGKPVFKEIKRYYADEYFTREAGSSR